MSMDDKLLLACACCGSVHCTVHSATADANERDALRAAAVNLKCKGLLNWLSVCFGMVFEFMLIVRQARCWLFN